MELLTGQPDYCPYLFHDNVPVTLLFRLATRNKVEHVLSHFVKCNRCHVRLDIKHREKVERLQKLQVVRSLFYVSESKRIQSLFLKQKIYALLFKSYKLDLRKGSDIDILVSPSNFSKLVFLYKRKGYRISIHGGLSKEAHLTNPETGFTIDLHFLVAYPHYGKLRTADLLVIKQISQEIVAPHQGNNWGVHPLSIEWYILIQAVCFWHNDLLVGLGSLYRLCMACRIYADRIDWQKILALANRFAFRNKLFFVLMLTDRLFPFGFPDHVRRLVPRRIHVFARAQTIRDLVDFPPIAKWNYQQFSAIAQRKMRRYMLLNIATDPLGLFWWLFRPRLALFTAHTLCSYLLRRERIRTFI